jgi:two-component system, NarL family, response regulator NreC
MLRIVVVDDHHVVRQGLRGFLETEPEFIIVGEAANGVDACTVVEELQPDVLIVDLIMPGLDGLEVTQHVTRHCPNIRVIILSMHGDEASVQKALASGAAGYVLKDSTAGDLVRAIRDVVAGRRYLSAPLSERAIEAFVRSAQQAATDEDDHNALTHREQEVLRLAALGFSNTEIATKLIISPRTAEAHRAKMMRKLGLRSQTELVLYALRQGILQE